jgi:polyhydroxyalkanoate synthase
MQMGKGGLLKGRTWPSTFSFLRPNDLVWNYVVGNYLKGETPPPFDLLYWNSDSTNLPGPFYAWYLRNTYLENNLVKPGKAHRVRREGGPGQGHMPVYIYGSREDHIVPIGAAYASTQVLPGKKRFVMGASGHIAGVINPPAKNKRSHWIRADGKLPATARRVARRRHRAPGSWWTDWSDWLKGHAGKQIAAPKGYGKGHQVQGHRAGARPLRQGQGLKRFKWLRNLKAPALSPTLRVKPIHLEEGHPWKTSSSFPPPAPPWASLAARWPRPRPPNWAPS